MSLREIVLWPDPRLAQTCAPVGGVTDAVRALADDMLETMYAAPGRGLAAPQIGVMQRLFVMDTSWKEGEPDPVVCIDPEILSVSQAEDIAPEGCLSIPGLSVDVSRPEQVRLAWTDLQGKRRKEELAGFAARCAQHELDHLNGIVTLERVSAETRARLVAEYEASR